MQSTIGSQRQYAWNMRDGKVLIGLIDALGPGGRNHHDND